MTASTRSSGLNKIERLVLDKLLVGEHPALATLRHQVARCLVSKREFSGKGFFTEFQLPAGETAVPTSRSRIRFGDVVAELHGVEGGAGFVLFVDDGYLVTLEGYVFVGAWPDEPEVESLRYDPNPRDLSGLE